MDKFYNLLGMAMKARKLVLGESVLNSIRNNKAKLVIIAEDASDNTKKRYTDKCNYYHIDYIFVESSIALSAAIGKYNRMAVAVIDEGFAKKLKTLKKG